MVKAALAAMINVLSLIVAGFSAGTVFILLTARPAVNTITISVIHKTLGETSLYIYLLAIILASVLLVFW